MHDALWNMHCANQTSRELASYLIISQDDSKTWPNDKQPQILESSKNWNHNKYPSNLFIFSTKSNDQM